MADFGPLSLQSTAPCLTPELLQGLQNWLADASYHSGRRCNLALLLKVFSNWRFLHPQGHRSSLGAMQVSVVV